MKGSELRTLIYPLTQADFARILGVSSRTVSNWVQDRFKIPTYIDTCFTRRRVIIEYRYSPYAEKSRKMFKRALRAKDEKALKVQEEL